MATLNEKKKAPKDMKVGADDAYKAMAHADWEKRQENGAFVKSGKHKSPKDYTRKEKHKKDWGMVDEEDMSVDTTAPVDSSAPQTGDMLAETKDMMKRMGLLNEKPEKKHLSVLREHYTRK